MKIEEEKKTDRHKDSNTERQECRKIDRLEDRKKKAGMSDKI